MFFPLTGLTVAFSLKLIGALETRSLRDVLEHNRAALAEAVEDEK